MKLRNKKTGGIRELPDGFFCGNNLKKICEEWEDYEEPKKYFCIGYDSNVYEAERDGTQFEKGCLEIGNYFETKEEAERAVRKLKAFKRLKDKGFRFTAWKNGILLDETVAGQVRYEFPIDNKNDIEKDLDLLFSGEGD